jgi:hypothetical protein
MHLPPAGGAYVLIMPRQAGDTVLTGTVNNAMNIVAVNFADRAIGPSGDEAAGEYRRVGGRWVAVSRPLQPKQPRVVAPPARALVPAGPMVNEEFAGGGGEGIGGACRGGGGLTVLGAL